MPSLRFISRVLAVVILITLSSCSIFYPEPEVPKDLGYAAKYLKALPYPLRSKRISSRYGDRWGSFHRGIDFPSPLGSAVFATHDGVVVQSGGFLSGYGNAVIVRDKSFETLYAHLDQVHLRKGRKVLAGDPIGEVGATGKATGYHLHFETRVRTKDGKFISLDPKLFLK